MFFYYPIKRTADDNIEFKYSLRALEKYFKDDFTVIVCGDFPTWLNLSSVNIITKPYSTSRYDDSTKKLIKVCNLYDEFIWIHDDMYLLDYQDTSTIKDIYYLEYFKNIKKFGNKYFQKQLKKINDIFVKLGKDPYNYACHTPMYFKSKELLNTINIFNLDKDPQLYIETYHYNTYPPKEMKNINPYKIGRYDSTPVTIKDFAGKKFANCDENGLKSGMFDIIETMFPNKSKFEK